MGLFRCTHEWVVTETSNAIQQDIMGYPLMLCVCECKKCGKTDQQWIDVGISYLDKVKRGDCFLLEWNRRADDGRR